jgi:hypothetical protein
MTDQIVRTLDDEEITPAAGYDLSRYTFSLRMGSYQPTSRSSSSTHSCRPLTAKSFATLTSLERESPDSSKRKETLRHRFSRLSQPRHQMLRITACPGSIPRCRIC